MADFNVATMFTGIDKVSKVFGKQSRAAIIFGDKTARAFNKASRSGNKFGSVLKGVLGANIIGRGFGILARGLRNVINEFIDFDDAIISASAKFDGFVLGTEAGTITLNKMKKAAREVGQATEFTSAQAAKALDFLALAGFNAEQSIALLPGVVDLATSAGIDLARASDIATDALSLLNMNTDDSVQLGKNFTKILDLMATTMTSTNTDMEQLFESMKGGAKVFLSTGQSVETLMAFIGTMASQGIKAEKGGVQLRNMMLNLIDDGGAAGQVMRELGLNIDKGNGSFKSAVDIMKDLRKSLKGLDEIQRVKALKEIFLKRGFVGVKTIQDGLDFLIKFEKKLQDVGGANKKLADTMRESLGNRLKALQSASIELGFKILEAFDKRGRKGIDALTAAVRKFNPKPIVDFIENSITVFKNLNAVLKLTPFNLFDLVKGLIAVKVAMWAVNIAMLANPVGIVIFAVASLAAFLALMVLNWDNVVANFKIGTRSIKFFFADLWDTARFDFFNFIIPILKFLAKAQGFLGFDTSKEDAFVKELEKSRIDAVVSIAQRILDEAQRERVAFINSQGGLRDGRGGNVEAPNKTEIESRQQIGFDANININGAPAGTTVSSRTTGAPPVNMTLAGANE